MNRMAGFSEADLQTRISSLERELSELRELVKMRWHERTPKLLLPTPKKLWVGQADGAIALNATGTVSRYADPWTGTAYTDTTTNDTVRTIIGAIAINQPVLYGEFEGIADLIAIQSKCAT